MGVAAITDGKSHVMPKRDIFGGRPLGKHAIMAFSDLRAHKYAAMPQLTESQKWI
jgi:hypothetical protein